jgi:hypothetical protein
MMQQQQHMAARARHLFRSATARAASLAAARIVALGGSVLLSACVSGTSGDTACANNSLDAPLTGQIAGSVVVPRGATCYLKAQVAGDVNAKDGAKVYVLDGTRIAGSFRAVGASVVRFNLDASRASTSGSNRSDATAGKIVVGSNLIIKESRLDGQSGIAATEIGGNLVIVRNEAADANARMNVCTPGLCKSEAVVKVGKSVKIKQNQLAVAMGNTRIGADLKCASNKQAPVLLKSAAGAGGFAVKGRRSGQCEQLREIVVAPGGTPVAPASTVPVTPKA